MTRKSLDSRQIGDWHGFFEEFKRESPRGGALLGPAFLEQHLNHLLAAFFIDEGGLVGDLLRQWRFQTKIKVAYCLGLISQADYEDLEHIRKVRNLFAHALHDMSFDSEEVIKQCGRLKCPKSVFPAKIPLSADTQFFVAVSLMVHQLEWRATNMKKHERRQVLK